MIPIIQPTLGEQEIVAVAEVVRSGWVTQGPRVAAFEGSFAAFVGAPHACAVSSCTTALHLALLAAGVTNGDEVITVSHSFVATANAVRYCGAIPVFIDVEPRTFNIDPLQIESRIGPRTKAILAVHQMGMPCDLAALRVVADSHGLVLIEDAACAVGSEIRRRADGGGRPDHDPMGDWQRIGAPWGDIACFSFHPRKLLTTGDGGMLTTANPEWDASFRRWRQHGMTVPDTVRHGSRSVVFESYEGLGFNYRMTDIQAAIGQVQLARLPEVVVRRRARAARYSSRLAAIAGVAVPHEPEWARSNYQSYCVRLDPACDQIRVMQHMLDADVATRRGIVCSHREPVYGEPDGEAWSCGAGPGACGCAAGRCRALAESERAQDTCIILPLYDTMTDDDQDRVVTALADAVDRG